MADLNIVMEKLQSFETADSLADYFRDYGIIAQPRQARSCAIAKFVRIETGRSDIVVNSTSLRIETEKYKVVEQFLHTNAMEDFVESYDRGCYPDLVEEGFEVQFQYKCCKNCG